MTGSASRVVQGLTPFVEDEGFYRLVARTILEDRAEKAEASEDAA